MLRLRVASLIVAATCAVAVVKFVDAMSLMNERAAENEARPPLQRLFPVDVDRQFLLAARRLVPPDARYVVETGPNTPVSSPFILSGLQSYSLYALLPRRQVRVTDTNTPPEYVLCYGCDTSGWTDRADVVWKNDSGIVIARVPR